MKNFKISGLLLMLLTFMLVFVSCSSGGDDDEGNSNPSPNNSGLSQKLQSKKWHYENEDYSSGDDYVMHDREIIQLFFTSSSDGIVSYYRKTDYSDGDKFRKDIAIPFTYKVSGNNVSLQLENGDSGYFVYSSGVLVLNNSSQFVPQDITSGDLDWIKEHEPKIGKCGNNLSWRYNENTQTLRIYGKGDMYNYKSSSQPWKDLLIYNIELEEGITSIGSEAFSFNQYISSVDFPATLTKIGDHAFYKTPLQGVSIPNEVVRIGESAFSGCENLKKLYIYEDYSKLEYIGKDAFLDCPIEMYCFTFPKNLKEIGQWAFMSSDIKKIEINEGFRSIGGAVFTNLNCDVILPNSVQSVGSLAFGGYITKVVIGSGLTTIANGAFVSRAKYGKIYVNNSVPPTVTSNGYAICEDYENWDLYVPKGAKSAYQKHSSWRRYANIYEDGSLDGSGSDNNDSGDDNNSNDAWDGSISGHKYVDLGLPSGTKWATCNVGASSPEDYGDYFAWGETQPKSSYIEENSKTYGIRMDDISGNSQYDAARYNWGGTWRMPTEVEIMELVDNCTWKWTSQNGVNGSLVTGKNGNTIFLPAAGERFHNWSNYVGERGMFWSSTPHPTIRAGAEFMFILDDGNYGLHATDRYMGLPIRPVSD